ncbi:protein kinase [bacterium]|nr:protein kinase [bacterium]
MLKREVDTRVYGIPYPAAILQESLLNLNEDSLFPGQIGVLSERMKNDFDFRLKTTIQDAAVSGSLDNVYLFRDQLLRTISDRFIDSIRAENDRYLSSQEKSALQKVILERTEYARFTLARLDNAFADMINTMSDPLIIDGFEFKEKIGYGQYGVVVRAEKDGVEWALKIPVTNRDGKDVSFAEFQEILRVHNNEFAIIREKVNFGYQGRLAQTDGYPLVIMPVFTGKTLEEKLREELSADEKLELAIRLVEEFIRIEQAGIVFTDFNPSNILILDDGSARAIDFGMARIADDIPDKLSATHYYAFYAHASPEVIGASDLKKALKDFSSAPLNELVYDIRRAFTSSFNRQNLEENPHYMRLVTDVIPSAKRKLFDPALPESERSAIRRELEQAVVNALMGFIDHQSDIFAVGTVLYTIFTGGFIGEPSEKTQIRSIDADPLLPLLNDSIDAELQNIIRTMLRHIRSERYQNFSEMRDALEKYRGRIQAIPAQFAVLEASFEQKTQALATAAYWDERPFNKDMFRYNQRPVPFSDVRYECEKVYGGDIRLYRNYLQRYVEFYELFEKIIEQLDTLSTGDLFLAVDSIPGDSVQRPLKIILVDEDNLRFFGLNALTRAIPEDVTVYLPYERVADPADRGEIIQVLKREIDENVYGISFTESVLIESLANANLVYERSVGAEGRPSVLGTMSDRMSDNFIREVKQAVADARQSQSPDPLYELRDTFSTIILAGPQLKRSLDRADALPPVTKQLVARLIDEVQKEAELSIIRLEYELADLAQSVTSPVIIRGFEIKELLGVGGYGIVYRVEKDGIEYAVKLPIAKHRADREPRMVREEKFLTSAELSRILNEQRKDAYFTNRVYGDVYQTRELDPAMKSYPLYVLPVFKGKTLWQYLDETIFTQDELIGIMIKIVAEFRILEENGIVMNDVSPNNIFLMEDGTVRIFDFGVALSEDHLPHSFDEPFQGGTRPFLSPERNQVNDAADDFLRMVYRYESLEQFLDNMDEYPSVFIRHFTRQQLRENRLLDAFLSDGLFQIKQQIANRQIKTLTDARNAVSAAVIPILAAMFDHRSDIFTLGTIFYWMGVMDKSGSVSDLELEKVASMDDVSTFPYLAERMRPELGGIVRKMIQKDPRNRYQNFEDIYRDLIRFSDQLQENHASFAGGMLQSLKQILYPDSPSGITSDMVRGIAESWKKWGVAEQMLGYLPAFRKNTQAVYNDLRTGLEPLGIDAVQYEESFRMFGELLPIILQKIGGVTLDQKELVLESVYGSGKNVVIHFVDAHNLTEVGLDALSVEHDNMVSMYLPANLENAEMFFQILKRELDIHVLSMHPVQAVVFETFLNPKGFLSKTLFVSDRISGRIRSLVKTAAETSVQKNDPKPLQDIIAHLRSAFRHIDAIRQKIESEKKLISLRPMFNSFLEELIQEILFNLSSAEVSLIEMMLAQGREIEVRGYIFLRKLGEGGFGRVFLAERDNTLWAVKVLNPLVAGQLRNRDFLDKLVRVHMNDQRMHAVAYNDVSTYEHEYSGYPFIAVPYAAGKTVSKYMNIRELSLPEKMAVLISITDAFIALEDKGIVYNDVSPADFYIRDDGTVRILDFGMAKSSNDETYDIQDAFIIGTMPYISPELEAFRLLEEFVRKMRDISDAQLSDFMDSIKSKFEALVNADTLERNEKYQTFIAQTLVELKRQFQSQTIPLHRIRKELEQAVTAVMFSLIDHQSDQFEVGILFSEIVLGEPIGLNAAPYFFTGAVEFKDADPDFKPLDSIHPVLASIMKKTMRHKKSERYRNFKELKAALENFRDDIMEHAVVTAKYVGAHPQYNVQNRHIVGLGWKQHDVSSINVQEIEQFKEFLTARMDSIDRKLSEAFGDNAYSQTFRYFAEIVQRMSEQFQQAQAGQRSIRIDAVPGAPNAPPLEIIFVSGERLHEIGVSALTQKSSRQITMYFSIESITGGSPHIFFQNFKHEIDESVYNVGHTQAVLMESLLNPDDSQAVLGNVSARIRYDMSQVVQRAGFNDYDAAFSYLNDIVNQELVVRRSLETRKDITNREQIYAQQLAGNITAFALKSAGELTDRLLLDTEQVLDKVSIMNPPSAEHKQLGAYAELWTKRAVTSMLKTQIESQESRIARSNIQFDSFNTDEESRNAKKVYSASFSHYLETLQAIKAQFSTVAFGEEKDSIRIERIPGDSKQRPLTLYFVDKIELDHFGLNVYTVSDDTGVTIYLPRERAFLEQNNLVSVALLKFELDRHVYGLSYPQAVIAESIFNKKGTVEYTGVIGQISDRMRNDFEFFFAQAVQNTQVRGDLKYITLFRQYLEGIILKALEDKQIAESDTTLSPAEKQLFAEIIEDRAGEARYYLALADSYLSALSESMQDVSIQGFILIEKLGEGEYGRVYRAVKNGKEWALKIPKLQNRQTRHEGRSSFESDFKPVHDNEYYALHRAYDDVYRDEYGESLGYPLIAVPYKPAQTLSEKLSIGISQDEALVLISKILDEIIILHDKGVILNDINPGNILVFPDGSVRIIDFGMARLNSFIPSSLKYLGHKSLMAFASPEILGMGLVVGDLSLILQGTYTLEDFYVTRLENFIQLGFDKDDLASNKE